MITRLAQSIGCTFFPRASSHPTWTNVATMATAVATKMSQIWMATKNKATGKRSNRNFIQGPDSTRLLLSYDLKERHGAGTTDRICRGPGRSTRRLRRHHEDARRGLDQQFLEGARQSPRRARARLV